MIARIKQTNTGKFEILTGHGLVLFHGAYPTFGEACDAARRQCFSLANAAWDNESKSWASS